MRVGGQLALSSQTTALPSTYSLIVLHVSLTLPQARHPRQQVLPTRLILALRTTVMGHFVTHSSSLPWTISLVLFSLVS